MSLFYKAAYAVGFTPWDRTDTIPGEGDQILELVAAEEQGGMPFGKALDVGCGKGRYSIALARRGWQVTGVDAVSKAVALSRARAERAGVQAEFVEADVRELDRAVGPGYRLLLDGGCFHGLSDGDRTAVVRAEDAVSEPGATLIMLAFQPRGGPGPRGITREQLVETYAGWTLVDEHVVDVARAPWLVRRAEPRIYRFRRS